MNCMLMEKVQVMMVASQLPDGLWGKALMHVTFLKNRTWTQALPNGVTPYKLFYGERPNLKGLPIWGHTVWVHDKSGNKLNT